MKQNRIKVKKPIKSNVYRTYASGKSLRTTIPFQIATEMNFQPGDELHWEIDDGKIILRRVVVIKEVKE